MMINAFTTLPLVDHDHDVVTNSNTIATLSSQSAAESFESSRPTTTKIEAPAVPVPAAVPPLLAVTSLPVGKLHGAPADAVRSSGNDGTELRPDGDGAPARYDGAPSHRPVGISVGTAFAHPAPLPVPPPLPPIAILTAGHFSMQGLRPEMEDRVTLLAHPEFNRIANFRDYSRFSQSSESMSESVGDSGQNRSQSPSDNRQNGTPARVASAGNGTTAVVAAATAVVAASTVVSSLSSSTSSTSASLLDIHRSFFAVFDGHGGDVSAEYCRQHVHNNLMQSDSFLSGDPSGGLRYALAKTESDFCAACRRINLLTSSGTTAITAYIEADMCYVANIGDSRAVLCRSGKSIDASTDHKPGRKDEKARIEALGGRVGITEEDAFRASPRHCPCLIQCMSGGRPLRVWPGGLSVSRTIGDISMKSTALVSSESEAWQSRLTSADEFLLLACDGVWDVMNSQQAVDAVRSSLKKAGNNADDAAKHLATEAYRRGSTDNISVVVVTIAVPPVIKDATTAANKTTATAAIPAKK